MGYVKHSVPVRDVAHKLYLPHRFYPLNIFPRYEICIDTIQIGNMCIEFILLSS